MVDAVAPDLYLDWLDLPAAPGFAGTTGRLGMTILPGRRCSGKTAKEPRDLELDAATLASIGIDAFILLVEDHELVECGVPAFGEVMRDHGIEVVRCPIVDHQTPVDPSSAARPLSDDGRVPAPGDVEAFAALLRDTSIRLRAGYRLGVSCHGGVGRTGTFAACLLKEAGLDAETAIDVVRRCRRGAIETAGQEAFVRAW
jgi:protein-tyrosine phosphatase